MLQFRVQIFSNFSYRVQCLSKAVKNYDVSLNTNKKALFIPLSAYLSTFVDISGELL